MAGSASFVDFMSAGLPLNRKERFFTGTVFPMIVCCDGFTRLGPFLHLIDGCEPVAVEATVARCNIQFFTEYSLLESLHPLTLERFPKPRPTSNDTPDIMMLIQTSAAKVLIACEAKVYEPTTPLRLRRQLEAQAVILDYIRTCLAIDSVFHVALLPAELARKGFEQLAPTYQLLTWEQIYEAYAPLAPDDYFLAVLRLALDSYQLLVGKSVTFGRNNQQSMRGEQILDSVLHPGELELTYQPVAVGRTGGLHGSEFAKDVATNAWRTRSYETSSLLGLAHGNPNWFTADDFVKAVSAHLS